MKKIGPSQTIKSWQELVKLDEFFSDSDEEWVFRGEAKRRVPLTTLERACNQFAISQDIPQLKRVLVKQFQRIYPIYAPEQVPEIEDTIHWLSLMRHYGAPTRLLDFTFSMLIATFFAIESPVEIKPGQFERAAVWAISKTWLTKHCLLLLESIGQFGLLNDWNSRKGSAFQKIFWEQTPALQMVFPVNPLRLHERLHVQQGLFLCPGDVSISFQENLLALKGWDKKVKLFEIDDSCRPELLWKLARAGTSRESLFPGLEGFAGSLRVAGPLLFQHYKRLEKTGGRISTDVRNEFEYPKFSTKI